MTDKEVKKQLALAKKNAIMVKKQLALAKKNAIMVKKHCEMVKKHCEMVNQQIDQIKDKRTKEIETQKIKELTIIKPLEENYGETVIKCNYCKMQNRCVLIYFPIHIIKQCCSLQKLPVEYSRVVEKFPKEKLTEFLNNSLQ